MPFQKDKIKQAVEKELNRGGQVIFVHNRVQGLNAIEDKLKEMLPNIQMTTGTWANGRAVVGRKYPEVFNHESDLLLCTTIVETGMDFQRANTIIINSAHLLGLSQLYQLRGRVGRRAHIKPYCYFIVRKNGSLNLLQRTA